MNANESPNLIVLLLYPEPLFFVSIYTYIFLFYHITQNQL